MEDIDNEVTFDESPVKRDVTDTLKERNILEDIKMVNQEMADPGLQTFKKTTYWHQHPNIKDANIETILKDMTEQLVRIEEKISKIESSLEK